jgi:Flp pilus assembly protein TadG
VRGLRDGDDGMVTAETAVVLPVLLFVLAGAVAAVTVVGAQLRCVDAVREGARAAARGEDVATVRTLVLRAAPDGMTVSVTQAGDDVRVGVAGRIAPLGPIALDVEVSAEATARLEPAAENPGGEG